MPRVFNLQQAAGVLNISPARLRVLFAEGVVPGAYKDENDQWAIAADDLKEYFNQRRQAPRKADGTRVYKITLTEEQAQSLLKAGYRIEKMSYYRPDPERAREAAEQRAKLGEQLRAELGLA